MVEDYGPIRIALRDRLKEDGYLVDVASDGEGAFDHICESTYAVIVLDLMLPDVTGFEVLKTIREQALDTAVMIITARDEISDRVAGLDMGADDYMVKPFDLDELLARIRALLRRAQPNRPKVLRFSDLSLDTGTRQASRGDRIINLTAKEPHRWTKKIHKREQKISRRPVVFLSRKCHAICQFQSGSADRSSAYSM